MELTIPQTDALTEVVNIGYGRAASALAELTGHRVTLAVPRITMHPIEQIAAVLSQLVEGEVASVNQVFSGAISGNALLMLDEKSAMMLSHLLSDDASLLGSFDTSGQEIITEVGNILLNACLGAFGNLLQVRVSFAVPRLHIAGVGGILKSVRVESEALQHGLMIHTHFQLRASNITGYLIIILGITSLDRLLREVENWEIRQTS
jgi:chemotaxis protein CheC